MNAASRYCSGTLAAIFPILHSGLARASEGRGEGRTSVSGR